VTVIYGVVVPSCVHPSVVTPNLFTVDNSAFNATFSRATTSSTWRDTVRALGRTSVTGILPYFVPTAISFVASSPKPTP